MTNLGFSLDFTRFDDGYRPLASSRITTNFANLARGEKRKENLRRAFGMIDERFDDLAARIGVDGTRYGLELDIVSVSLDFQDADGRSTHDAVPLIEVLQTTILDRASGECLPGIVGNNFSSYVRDYDFSIRLPQHAASAAAGEPLPADFGDLHGTLFKAFVRSDAFAERFAKPPVICLSVSSSKTYHRTDTEHPVLGVEYRQSAYSSTDAYFAKMGLGVRFFMPPGSRAPLAFYFDGDLTGDYSDLELIATISTMETFQKIYRPEIYSATDAAGQEYRPSLSNPDFEPTGIVYDREERSRLAIEQGRFAEEHFIDPHKEALEEWSAGFAARERNVDPFPDGSPAHDAPARLLAPQGARS
ncbi:putative oxygenase MesX [Herbiconiux sp. A18JL235]|uniref:Oxygenase MesX n=1 Tax=Herbiconiux sp. A18JL235 TaxID=3152363 RepID=A0AB39BDE3_9MICO